MFALLWFVCWVGRFHPHTLRTSTLSRVCCSLDPQPRRGLYLRAEAWDFLDCDFVYHRDGLMPGNPQIRPILLSGDETILHQRVRVHPQLRPSDFQTPQLLLHDPGLESWDGHLERFG